jgi:integrase
LLRSIDQTTPPGRRDYTMFFLIATYGLRASEIVALTLDAIDWRHRLLRVPQRKTGTPLLLPLTDPAGTVLVRYLRRGRPPSPHRELFLRECAPAGVLQPTAVGAAFQKWVRRSGLPIVFQGPHCLRHSYAVHLLRRGVPLKTIGDLLGHRTAESTSVYLRLATDDLRRVALPLPRRRPRETQP